jgi:hypothetical protein
MGREYPIKGFNFCIAFGIFKMAVIFQGVSMRMIQGVASSKKAILVSKLLEPTMVLLDRFINKPSMLYS